MSIERGTKIAIPVAVIEFVEGGNTLWVHNGEGMTVLRLKFDGGIHSSICTVNPSSHADAIFPGALAMCLHESDAESN